MALMVGDQRSGDIVAISRALLGGMGWGHAIALAVKQQAGEQARLARACTGGAVGSISGELRLNRMPQSRIDNRGVFAGMGLSLVHDLAAIEKVLQHQVECTAREWLAANAAIR